MNLKTKGQLDSHPILMCNSCPLEHYMQRPTQLTKRQCGQNHNSVNLSDGLLHVGKGVLPIDMELLTFFIKRTSPSEQAQLPKEKIVHALSPSPAPPTSYPLPIPSFSRQKALHSKVKVPQLRYTRSRTWIDRSGYPGQTW